MEKKLIELEKRVTELELINKKNKRNKKLTFIITVIFLITIMVLYIFVFSKIVNNYTVFF